MVLQLASLDIENTIAKAENYLSRMFRHMKKDTGKIRELTSRLVSEHIEKIKTQLIQQPPLPFHDEVIRVITVISMSLYSLQKVVQAKFVHKKK